MCMYVCGAWCFEIYDQVCKQVTIPHIVNASLGCTVTIQMKEHTSHQKFELRYNNEYRSVGGGVGERFGGIKQTHTKNRKKGKSANKIKDGNKQTQNVNKNKSNNNNNST